MPVRKLGTPIVDDDPIKGAYRKSFTENPVVEARAKLKRGRLKKGSKKSESSNRRIMFKKALQKLGFEKGQEKERV